MLSSLWYVQSRVLHTNSFANQLLQHSRVYLIRTITRTHLQVKSGPTQTRWHVSWPDPSHILHPHQVTLIIWVKASLFFCVGGCVVRLLVKNLSIVTYLENHYIYWFIHKKNLVFHPLPEFIWNIFLPITHNFFVGNSAPITQCESTGWVQFLKLMNFHVITKMVNIFPSKPLLAWSLLACRYLAQSCIRWWYLSF